MVAPFLTSQAIRYVTERVVENLSRQAMQNRVVDAPPSNLESMAVVAHLNSQISLVEQRLDEIVERLDAMDARVAAAESKVGWRAMVRLIFGIIVGILLGFAGAAVAHLTGWWG